MNAITFPTVQIYHLVEKFKGLPAPSQINLFNQAQTLDTHQFGAILVVQLATSADEFRQHIQKFAKVSVSTYAISTDKQNLQRIGAYFKEHLQFNQETETVSIEPPVLRMN